MHFDHPEGRAAPLLVCLALRRGAVLSRDVLLAEAQDSATDGARNNANMATPGDGMSPRMQVYLWTGADHINVTATPGNRTPQASGGSFDPESYDPVSYTHLTLPTSDLV